MTEYAARREFLGRSELGKLRGFLDAALVDFNKWCPERRKGRMEFVAFETDEFRGLNKAERCHVDETHGNTETRILANESKKGNLAVGRICSFGDCPMNGIRRLPSAGSRNSDETRKIEFPLYAPKTCVTRASRKVMLGMHFSADLHVSQNAENPHTVGTTLGQSHFKVFRRAWPR